MVIKTTYFLGASKFVNCQVKTGLFVVSSGAFCLTNLSNHLGSDFLEQVWTLVIGFFNLRKTLNSW